MTKARGGGKIFQSIIKFIKMERIRQEVEKGQERKREAR